MAALRVLRAALRSGHPIASPRYSTVTSTSNQSSNNVAEDKPMENPFKEPPKRCILCGVQVDYKNVQLLSQFVSPHTGRIYGRHITGMMELHCTATFWNCRLQFHPEILIVNGGLCGTKQKEIAKAIKRAHIMGFMPVTYKDPAFLKDPKIVNI